MIASWTSPALAAVEKKRFVTHFSCTTAFEFLSVKSSNTGCKSGPTFQAWRHRQDLVVTVLYEPEWRQRAAMDGKIRQNEFSAAPPCGNGRQWTATDSKIRHKRIFGHASAGIRQQTVFGLGERQRAATDGKIRHNNGQQGPTQTDFRPRDHVAMSGNGRQDPTQTVFGQRQWTANKGRDPTQTDLQPARSYPRKTRS